MAQSDADYEQPLEKEENQDVERKRPYRPTVEIPVFLVMFGTYLGGGAMTNILLYRTCTNSFDRPESECALLLESGPKSNDTKHLENEVQQYLSIVKMIHSVSEALFPAILSLFLGGWSTKHGRKPLIMWPLLGMSISALLTVFVYAIPSLGPWWYLITAIPFSLSGGHSALFTGVFCYLTDITTKTDRSFRIALMEAALFSGSIFGTIGGPYLLELIGGLGLLIMATVIYSLAYAYTLFWINESVVGATRGKLTSIFDFKLVTDIVRTFIKKRPNKDRTILFLLMVCGTFSVPYTSGLDYMYARNKLQWSLETYSIYSVVNTLTMIIGMIVGVTLLQKLLKIGDVWLTLLAYMSSAADFLIKALAMLTWHMYLGTSISLFRGLAHPLIRSTISKILPIEDTARIFTLLSIFNVTLPMLAPLVFNPLYSATLNSFPGTIYLVCVGIHAMNFLLLCIAKYYMWRYPASPKEEVMISQ